MRAGSLGVNSSARVENSKLVSNKLGQKVTPAHCSTSDKSSPPASAVTALEVADVRQ